MKVMKRPAKNGQNLVEMALLLPVLLILAVVTFDLGRVIYYYSLVYNAAREGARYGVVHQQPYNTSPLDTVNIVAAARDLAVGIDPAALAVDVGNPIISDTLQVSVRYPFYPVTPLVESFLHYSVQCKCKCLCLTSTSSMRIER